MQTRTTHALDAGEGGRDVEHGRHDAAAGGGGGGRREDEREEGGREPPRRLKEKKESSMDEKWAYRINTDDGLV